MVLLKHKQLSLVYSVADPSACGCDVVGKDLVRFASESFLLQDTVVSRGSSILPLALRCIDKIMLM